MTFKKNVFIATLIMLLKKESEEEDSDINVRNVIEIFKAKNNYQDSKPNYGTNMFGKNKAFLI
jgi:hypothetical protein